MEFKTKREAEEAEEAARRKDYSAQCWWETATSPLAGEASKRQAMERAQGCEAEAARIRALLPTLEE